MEMKNMKLDQKQMDQCMPSVVMDKQEYPYGLRITLENDALKKLGMKELPEVGSYVMVMAKAYVCHKSESESLEREDYCLSLQITDMAVKSDMKSDPVKKLYADKEDDKEEE